VAETVAGSPPRELRHDYVVVPIVAANCQRAGGEQSTKEIGKGELAGRVGLWPWGWRRSRDYRLRCPSVGRPPLPSVLRSVGLLVLILLNNDPSETHFWAEHVVRPYSRVAICRPEDWIPIPNGVLEEAMISTLCKLIPHRAIHMYGLDPASFRLRHCSDKGLLSCPSRTALCS